MVEIVKREGFLALYRGLMPGLMKSVPATAVTFLVYGQMERFFQQRRRTT